MEIQHQTAPAEFSTSSKLISIFVVQGRAEFYGFTRRAELSRCCLVLNSAGDGMC